jgi:hypothetical protein
MQIYPAQFLGDRDLPIDAKLCFVIMPYTASWSDRVYVRLKAAVEGCGYTCRRADELYGRVVLRDIWQGINAAAFVVADLSDENPNVYYELGLAHALGKDIIPLLQSGQTIPFDQTPFRVLSYESSEAGLRALETQLTAWVSNLDFSSVPELMLRKGDVTSFNSWRQTATLRSLQREDLSEAALAGVDFHGANLAEANLSAADLRRADLSDANLIRCNLERANLADTVAFRANLSEARLAGVRMSGADLTRVIILRPDLAGADLTQADVAGLTIDQASYARFESVFESCRNREGLIVER